MMGVLFPSGGIFVVKEEKGGQDACNDTAKACVEKKPGRDASGNKGYKKGGLYNKGKLLGFQRCVKFERDRFEFKRVNIQKYQSGSGGELGNRETNRPIVRESI